MPITGANVLFRYSHTTGPGNGAAGTPTTSLGGFVSTTAFTDATADNLFPDLTSTQNASGQIDYRCLFIYNSHSTLTLQNAVLWVISESAGAALMALAVDNVASSALAATSAQAAIISSSTTSPGSAVSAFSAPTSKTTGLALGNIPAGSVKAFWIRRSAQATGTFPNDSLTFRVEGNSAA